MGQEVQVSGRVRGSVVGYCRPIVDRTIVVNEEDAEFVLGIFDLPGGVSFVDDAVIDSVAATLAARRQISETTSPGGPVSNAIYAFANAQGSHPRLWQPVWTGPFPAGAGNTLNNPLPQLRAAGIRTVLQPAAGESLPQSLCLVARETGNTIAILVGDREVMTATTPLPSGHLALTMLSDLPSVLASGAGVAGYALMTADVTELTGSVRAALDRAADLDLIKFIFGTKSELLGLGFVDAGGRRSPESAGAEIVGTDGPNPVQVWEPSAAAPRSHDVQSIVGTEGGFLGAGDAYTGTYLAERLAGVSIESAHQHASAAARYASYHLRARAPIDTNLTELFGSHIERSSATADWDLFGTVRHSAGVTVIGCLNTGIDEIAASVASRWGLAYFGIMPQGRRRDGGAPPDLDILELGTPSYRYCTWANVYLSDGTLLVDIAGSEGSAETRRAAQALNRPLYELDVATDPAQTYARVAEWASTSDIRVVNIAGSRAQWLTDREMSRADLHIDAAVRALASQYESGVLDPPPFDIGERSVCGIPRLGEVSDAVRAALVALAPDHVDDLERGSLLWTVGSTMLIRGKSRDLVRAVGRGELHAAFVGLDMVLDEPASSVTVVARTGLFNSAVAVVGPQEPRRERGAVGAQYPNLVATGPEAPSYDVVPIAGAGEGWVSAGVFDAVIDTWRTGRTARRHHLEWRAELARCPLCLIVPKGSRAPGNALAILERLVRPAQEPS